MREITFWRLVFGLALVLTVPLLWVCVATSAGMSVLEFVATFAIVAIASLFVSGVVVWLAVEAYDAARRFGEFMAELLGLRD